MSNKIILKGVSLTIQKEAKVATAVITPGMLIQLDTAAGTIKPHGTAEGSAQCAYAIEAGLLGNDINDDYIVGDQCIYVVANKGCEINALVADGTAAIAKGDLLVSDGTGCLQGAGLATTGEAQNQVVALALEAVDNSGGSAPVRIKVEAV